MLPEASEVERLVVDQETDSVHLDGAHPDTLVIAVCDGVPVNQLQLKVIEVAVARSPPVRIPHAECAARPAPVTTS